jgi:DNA-binding NarL/FixJ family response regulator
MASGTTIRLLIAEDHTIMRSTLCSVLKQYADIEIVGEATNGEEAILRSEELQPAIVLMDINMPKLDGIEATRRIKVKSSRIVVLGLSVHGDGYSIDAMLKAGAVAVVPKERAPEDLYDAIQRAMACSLDSSVPNASYFAQSYVDGLLAGPTAVIDGKAAGYGPHVSP